MKETRGKKLDPDVQGSSRMELTKVDMCADGKQKIEDMANRVKSLKKENVVHTLIDYS